MDRAKVSRKLVLFGISDRPQRMMGLQYYLSKITAREGDGGCSHATPVAGPIVECRGGGVNRQTGAVNRDEAVDQLMLDSLKAPDNAPKLPACFGVINRQLERAVGRTERARSKT
jgi:hypothetical protein